MNKNPYATPPEFVNLNSILDYYEGAEEEVLLER